MRWSARTSEPGVRNHRGLATSLCFVSFSSQARCFLHYFLIRFVVREKSCTSWTDFCFNSLCFFEWCYACTGYSQNLQNNYVALVNNLLKLCTWKSGLGWIMHLPVLRWLLFRSCIRIEHRSQLSLKMFYILSARAFEVKAHWNFIAISERFDIYSIKADSFANSIK